MKGTRTTRFPRTAALAAGVVAGVAAWAFAPPAVQAEDGAPTTTAGADVEGLWRLEGRRLGAATWREQTLTGGRVRLWREGGALRYERAVRDATEAEVAAAVERGTATLTDGGLVLRPAEGPARLGLTKRLRYLPLLLSITGYDLHHVGELEPFVGQKLEAASRGQLVRIALQAGLCTLDEDPDDEDLPLEPEWLAAARHPLPDETIDVTNAIDPSVITHRRD